MRLNIIIKIIKIGKTKLQFYFQIKHWICNLIRQLITMINRRTLFEEGFDPNYCSLTLIRREFLLLDPIHSATE